MVENWISLGGHVTRRNLLTLTLPVVYEHDVAAVRAEDVVLVVVVVPAFRDAVVLEQRGRMPTRGTVQPNLRREFIYCSP